MLQVNISQRQRLEEVGRGVMEEDSVERIEVEHHLYLLYLIDSESFQLFLELLNINETIYVIGNIPDTLPKCNRRSSLETIMLKVEYEE